MAALINFKICDNDKACNGMEVCPMKVFSWNEEKKTLEIDNTKCISCGLCEKVCMVSAIKVAKNEEEYALIEKEIEDDPRSINDLLVERYGATPVDDAMIGTIDELDEKLDNASRPLIIEVNKEESIMCLLKSIPVKEIADAFDKETRYRKIIIDDEKVLKRFGNIKEFPSLLLFKNGSLIGKIEGYHTIDEKEDVISQIKSILNTEN